MSKNKLAQKISRYSQSSSYKSSNVRISISLYQSYNSIFGNDQESILTKYNTENKTNINHFNKINESKNQENTDNLNNQNFANNQNLQKKRFRTQYINKNKTISKSRTQEMSLDNDNDNIIMVEENNNNDNKRDPFRNYPNIILGNFFGDLLNFINQLIKDYNRVNNTNYNILYSNLKKGIYLESNTNARLEQLKKEAKIALNPLKNKDSKKESIKNYINNKVNNEILKSNEKNLEEIYKIDNIKDVLDKTVGQLMDIYLKKDNKVETFYNSFKKFDECETYITYKNKNQEEQKKLLDFAKNYQNILIRKKTNIRRGPKCK